TLAGEGPGERGRMNSLISSTISIIKITNKCGLIFQPDETLRVHPLPNPSPVKGEGLFELFSGD
ncbi:MAG: hypothetical protein ABW100_07985, partial [Candidatus Thiodiazotropha sp. 6PLUC3]